MGRGVVAQSLNESGGKFTIQGIGPLARRRGWLGQRTASPRPEGCPIYYRDQGASREASKEAHWRSSRPPASWFAHSAGIAPALLSGERPQPCRTVYLILLLLLPYSNNFTGGLDFNSLTIGTRRPLAQTLLLSRYLTISVYQLDSAPRL